MNPAEIQVDCSDDRKFELVKKMADYSRPHGQASESDGAIHVIGQDKLRGFGAI